MSIGGRIREARKAKNITLEALGAACGTTKQTIYKYETGVITNIPMGKIERIATFLDISPAYIVGWENSAGEPDLGLTAAVTEATSVRSGCQLIADHYGVSVDELLKDNGT